MGWGVLAAQDRAMSPLNPTLRRKREGGVWLTGHGVGPCGKMRGWPGWVAIVRLSFLIPHLGWPRQRESPRGKAGGDRDRRNDGVRRGEGSVQPGLADDGLKFGDDLGLGPPHLLQGAGVVVHTRLEIRMLVAGGGLEPC